MSAPEFLVEKLKVAGSFKTWGQAGAGISSGTDIEFTVIPRQPDQRGWTEAETRLVAVEVRLNIHMLLMADAQKRKIPLPHDATQTLIEYQEEVKRLRLLHTDRTEWKDASIPPPNTDSSPTREF